MLLKSRGPLVEADDDVDLLFVIQIYHFLYLFSDFFLKYSDNFLLLLY